jgi:hypothetical protein
VGEHAAVHESESDGNYVHFAVQLPRIVCFPDFLGKNLDGKLELHNTLSKV